MATSKEKSKKSEIFNLSRYLRVYVNDTEEEDEGENIRGIMVSGYRTDGEGNKQYCNIWIDKDFSIKKRSDGTYALMLRMVEKEIKE